MKRSIKQESTTVLHSISLLGLQANRLATPLALWCSVFVAGWCTGIKRDAREVACQSIVENRDTNKQHMKGDKWLTTIMSTYGDLCKLMK